MTESPRRILREALSLDDADRARLAAELLASLDGGAEERVEAAWTEAIRRRAAEARAGDDDADDWRPVLDAIQQDVLGR